MSVDNTTILLEGFLQKRKDTLKLIWVTYWFRLQNTTLFFYTKNCSASHLRGYYYIYTVQSVTVVHGLDSKRFMFQIILKNGKRKTLAAETAALRKQWVTQLWEAMSLSVSGLSERRGTASEECEQRDGQESSTQLWPRSPSLKEPPGSPAPVSAASLIHNLYESKKTVSSSKIVPQEQKGDSFNNQQSNTESRSEGVYDVLPLRNQMCEIDGNKLLREGVYDTPVFRRTTPPQEMCEIDGNKLLRECVYDTPVFRRMTPPQESAESIYNIPRVPTSALTPDDHHEDMDWRI
ncbi:uncharacterized protein LOC112488442 isoform X2 [Cynoglossus semilaevis]|uniref:uncharacterized protein LOC112488442 isoform X2 n=1 Tax=Cynoglossus semilaevis TaxID=244447 RepID=UPI000D6306A0|nr:uncharacterized protein LOC112488442 isoform X2 [Cynoglossus semilaevis]